MMKQKTGIKKRVVSLLVLGALTAGLFTACGSSTDANTLTVALVAPMVNQTAVDQYNTQLKEKETELIAIMAGDGAANKMAEATGLMQFTTMLAAGELDVVVSDLENAARNARGEAYVPLSDYLSAEEIAALGDRALDFQQADEEGNLTDGRTAVCGIRLERTDALKEIFGEQELGIFLTVNTEKREAAEKAVRYLMENA